MSSEITFIHSFICLTCVISRSEIVKVCDLSAPSISKIIIITSNKTQASSINRGNTTMYVMQSYPRV